MKDPTSGNMTRRNVTLAGEPYLSRKKTSTTIIPFISGLLTSQIAVPLIIMCAQRLSERQTKFHVTPQDNGRIYQFKQGDRRKGLQQSIVEVNGNFFR